MGLDISKHDSSYSFRPISAKLHENIGYHSEIQSITFLGNQSSFKHFVALWNFSMEVNGKILKCAICWKRDDRRAKRWKFETHGPMSYLYRVLFCVRSLISVWDLLVHFAKFPMFRFAKGYCSHIFIYAISTKLYGKHGYQGKIQLLRLANCKTITKKYCTWKCFLTKDHMGLKIAKRYSFNSF